MLYRALLFALAAAIPCLAQSDDDMRIRRPQDIDEATWERLKKKYADEKEEFAKYLAEMDRSRVDLQRDLPEDVLRKMETLRKLSEAQDAIRRPRSALSEAVALNYIGFLNATSPRLSGRIVEWATPAEADVDKLAPGDLVRVGEGTFGLGDRMERMDKELVDVAFVGSGGGKTTMFFELDNARRVRFENLSIDCHDSECLNLREGGSVCLRKCRISNFNSGAGGSNAIFGVGAVLLLEDCEFEGMTGRAGRNGDNGGDAFDLREENLLYLRRCNFVDCEEIARVGFPAAVEKCSEKNGTQWNSGISVHPEGRIFVRDPGVTLRNNPPATAFERATDDPEFVRYASGEIQEIDEVSRRVAAAMEARRNLPYWIGLLRHPDAKIREKAAARVAALTGKERPKPPSTPAEIDTLIARLDADDAESRDNAEDALLAAGEPCRAKLTEATRSGKPEISGRAKSILARLDLRKEMGAELECARLLDWFEKTRDRLQWDEAAGRYVEKR
ncbi:MAG: hypothetical protein FD180_5025 [Planctomycetota bacterium]|nr:MAG: hypothetical protein FD180_5025 [Planctomycetota bacterium]